MRVHLTIAALFLVAKAAVAADSDLAPRAGVLLLRNGSVIAGNILRIGDRYEVGFTDGDVRVRATDVDFVGDDLKDCYEHRRKGIDFSKVRDHLDLAEWCMRHDLKAQAGRELRDAIACDPAHPKIAVIERRLVMSLEDIEETEAAEPRRLGTATSDELDRMVRTMPSGTVETFTNTIQPLLLNQCSTSGCHGPSSSTSLRLIRVAPGKVQSRRSTQRNLHAVLNNINQEKPDNSPLLTLPIKPHGTNRTAVFTSRHAFQYKQIVDWAYAVSNKKLGAPQPAGVDAGKGWPDASDEVKPAMSASLEGKFQSATIAAKHIREQSEYDAAFSKANATRKAKSEPSDAKEDDLGTPATLELEDLKSDRRGDRLGRRAVPGRPSARALPKRGELPKEEQPKDPFDAEQFNKKYLEGDSP
jgi:hypothetical protein